MADIWSFHHFDDFKMYQHDKITTCLYTHNTVYQKSLPHQNQYEEKENLCIFITVLSIHTC